jgi:hypothetical protein
MGRILGFSPLPYVIDRGRRGGFLGRLLARTLVTRCVIQRCGRPALARDPLVLVVAPHRRRRDREAGLGSTSSSPGWRRVRSTAGWCAGDLLPRLHMDGTPRPGDVHPRVWLSNPTVNNHAKKK